MTKRTMTLRRFGELLETHGADLARWPEEERRAARALLAEDAAARALLAEHAALENLLARAAPGPSPALEERILAATVERDAAPARADAPRPPRWRWLAGAGALAASLLIGLALGLSGRLAPWPSPPLTQATLEADDELLALAWLGSPALNDAPLEEEGERP